MYSGDLNLDRFAIQLALLPDVVKTANTHYHHGVHKVTSINTVCEIFNTCSFPKTLLCEVDRLIRIYLTVPLTSVNAERSFSSLRRLKSYLRSTMTQKRLNHHLLLHIHRPQTDGLDLLGVAKEFISRNSHREEYFGHSS